MGRRQTKISLNNRKTNMTPPESSDSTPARSEKPNTEHEDEMDLKNYLGKMIETFKEETRKYLKEIEEKANNKLHKMEEKTNQTIQEINKSLKESKETQEKTSKQMKEVLETVQSMKAEIDTIKKTQNEAMLEMERLDKRSGTKDVSITNRIQEMEERISAIEDSLEDIHSSTKENLKSNKSLTQNIQEIWDTVKRPNLRIIGIEEGEETLLKGTENIFNKIIEENFPNLQKDMPMKVQEAYRTPNRLDNKKKSPQHIIIKTPNLQNKEKILRAAKEKGQVTYKGKPIRITPDFSMETLKARRFAIHSHTEAVCSEPSQNVKFLQPNFDSLHNLNSPNIIEKPRVLLETKGKLLAVIF
ncbi:LINE-1 type transposase domain-containing protein 1 [Cricetulus griseus]|nr:LINE-1 type transposase domain-containing protein 1 [Cricetulus griseus]